MEFPFIVVVDSSVVDSSGIHHLPFVTCSCGGFGQTISEMVAVGLLPSSFQEVKMVFTTACLDNYRFANLKCKTSTYQYYQMLKRWTNPANPMAALNRYAEFHCASREWRHLKKLKLHGFVHSNKFSAQLVLRPQSIWQVIPLIQLISMFFHKCLWH